jgi:hypothetical protein
MRFATILLALAVCIAAAYCPCAAAGTLAAQALGAADEHDAHACCRPVSESGSNRKDPAPSEHSCPHCMGTLATHQSGGTTVVAPAAPAPFAALLLLESRIAVVGFHSALLLSRTDLPPPSEACTLLNLSCSFLS